MPTKGLTAIAFAVSISLFAVPTKAFAEAAGGEAGGASVGSWVIAEIPTVPGSPASIREQCRLRNGDLELGPGEVPVECYQRRGFACGWWENWIHGRTRRALASIRGG
jgi:hypothetical protein